MNQFKQRFAKTAHIALALSCLAAPVVLHAELKFEQRVIEDTITPGAKSYPFEFSFTNEGDTAMEISEIKTTCGCTTAKLEKMTYAPGESVSRSFQILEVKI